jgi:hypothetical protein
MPPFYARLVGIISVDLTNSGFPLFDPPGGGTILDGQLPGRKSDVVVKRAS